MIRDYKLWSMLLANCIVPGLTVVPFTQKKLYHNRSSSYELDYLLTAIQVVINL